jgi:hypothetical protein
MRDSLKVQPFLAGAGDPARRVDALAVSVKQQSNHHGRVIRWKASQLRIDRDDPREIEFAADKIANQMRRMSRRNEVMHRWWQQPRVVNSPWAKGLAHIHSESLRRAHVERISAVTRTGS